VTPDLIIAGAPKCGSTSLFGWIASHPGVCASSVKETYFLMDEGYPLFRTENNIHKSGIQGYDVFFNHCIKEKKFLLEATPDYLYQKTALEVISSLLLSSKVLFILRKPSDRVFSLYQFAKNNVSVLPKNIGFREFVEEIMGGGTQDFVRNRPILQQAIHHSQYVDYLEQWVSRLGERVHVVFFEDMRDNPKGFMMKLSAQLGLDTACFEEFNYSAKNQTYTVKHQAFHKFKRKLSKILPGGEYRQSLRDIYAMLNTQASSKKTPGDIEVLKMLDLHFSGYNKRLENLLDIELPAWK
tara:strand:+ start:6112 stop:7002 length:891 start_codon:yes stop_codon:yes gene_type:complete